MQTHGYKVEGARLELSPLSPESHLAPLPYYSILLCVPEYPTREGKSGEEDPFRELCSREKLRDHGKQIRLLSIAEMTDSNTRWAVFMTRTHLSGSWVSRVRQALELGIRLSQERLIATAFCCLNIISFETCFCLVSEPELNLELIDQWSERWYRYSQL